MALLQVVQKAMQRTNKPKPTSAIGNPDPMVAHFVNLLEEYGQETVLRFPGQQLTIRSTWTTVAGEDQGTLVSLFGDKLAHLLDATVYDNSNDIVIWPITSPAAVEAERALPTSGPYSRFEIRGDHLYLVPAPTAGVTYSFQVKTTNWVVHPDSSSDRSLINDADEFLLPEELLILGLRAKWLAEKGLPYAEQFRSAELMLMNLLNKSTSIQSVMLDTETPEARPAVLVPNGSWSL